MQNSLRARPPPPPSTQRFPLASRWLKLPWIIWAAPCERCEGTIFSVLNYCQRSVPIWTLISLNMLRNSGAYRLRCGAGTAPQWNGRTTFSSMSARRVILGAKMLLAAQFCCESWKRESGILQLKLMWRMKRNFHHCSHFSFSLTMNLNPF